MHCSRIPYSATELMLCVVRSDNPYRKYLLKKKIEGQRGFLAFRLSRPSLKIQSSRSLNQQYLLYKKIFLKLYGQQGG